MALLWMDSFDHYVTADLLAKWTGSGVTGAGAAISIHATAGRRGSGAFRVAHGLGTNDTGYCQKTLAPADATVIVGCAMSLPSGLAGGSGCQVASIRDGATAQITLRLNADLTLSVVRGTTTGTVLGTTAAAVSSGVMTYLELKILIHASAGTVDLRINGASALSLTGQNTRNTGTAQWTSIVLGQLDVQSGTMTGAAGKLSDYDDLYVLDGTGAAPWNAFLGDVRVDVRNVTAEGAASDWTPSTGTDNAATIDDAAPNGDTDYNSTSTPGAIDTFVVQDAPVTGAVLYGVQIVLSLRKTDAGACTVAPAIRHSGTNYLGSDLSPSTSYAYGLQVYATNPGTSAQWTEAGFNAAELGYKRTT